MRRLVFALALVTASASAQGIVGDDGVFVVVEAPPTPVGGMAALAERVAYPEAALSEGAEGVVFVTLVVEADGTTRDVGAPQAPHPALAEAAIAAVEGLAFSPGRVNDEPVPTRISLPIRFELPAVAYADQPAEPLGGWRRLAKAIEWPAEARRYGVQGTFRLTVEVDSAGHLTEAEVELVRTMSETRTETRVVGEVREEARAPLPVERPRVSTVYDRMEDAILEAARATRFTPEIRDGEAVPGRASVTLPFIVRD